MVTIGVPLSRYTKELHHIQSGIIPTRTIEGYLSRLSQFPDEMECVANQYVDFDAYCHCSQLPQQFYEDCSFEELSKVYMSSIFQLARPQYELFENDLEYALIRKIKSSMWRWGAGRGEEEWNTLVDAYRGIRNFSFDLPEFEVTLTYTTGYNECGLTAFDRKIFLDGVFGFMVHHRGVHVMTIGFSIARGGKILLSQVQMKKSKGNRFLYKLPLSLVEYAIALLKKYFPTFKLYLVDANSAIAKYVSQYQHLLQNELEYQKNTIRNIASISQAILRNLGDSTEQEISFRREMANKLELEKSIAWIHARIDGLHGEIGARIRGNYQLTRGTWRLSQKAVMEVNKLRFFRIVRA